MAKALKSTRRKPALPFSLLCSVGKMDHSGARRLELAMSALKSAKIRAEIIVVDGGEGLAASLVSSPALKKAGARAFSAERGAQDWGRYCSAAATAVGEHCLLLPSGYSLAPALLKNMNGAAKKSDFVVLSGGAMPGWILSIQKWLWSMPGVDLGSPVIMRREFLCAIATGESPATSFLGPRLVRKAILMGSRGAIVKAPVDGLPRNPFSYLGDEVGMGGRNIKLLATASVGALLIFLGNGAITAVGATIGVAMVATGTILVGMVFGKE